MDPASIIILAAMVIIGVGVLYMCGEELIGLAGLVGIIWLIFLALDYQSTMTATTQFIHTAHDFLSQNLAGLGVR